MDEVALARCPLDFPELKQGIEIAHNRFWRCHRDAILASFIDKPQQTSNLLSGVGTQHIEICVPVRRECRKRAQIVVDVVDLTDPG